MLWRITCHQAREREKGGREREAETFSHRFACEPHLFVVCPRWHARRKYKFLYIINFLGCLKCRHITCTHMCAPIIGYTQTALEIIILEKKAKPFELNAFQAWRQILMTILLYYLCLFVCDAFRIIHECTWYCVVTANDKAIAFCSFSDWTQQ